MNCSDPNAILSDLGCVCKDTYQDIGVGCRPSQPYMILQELDNVIQVFTFYLPIKSLARIRYDFLFTLRFLRIFRKLTAKNTTKLGSSPKGYDVSRLA